MLRILEEEGIAREDITLLVGTGLHRPNEGEELVQLVGADIARNYRIVNHTARRRETLTYLGKPRAALRYGSPRSTWRPT